MACFIPKVYCLKHEIILIGVILTSLFQPGLTDINKLTQGDDCICPGFWLTYECTILGTGITVWSGTAFDCSSKSNQIILSHSQFQSGDSDVCNSGEISAKSVGITSQIGESEQCFSSLLNVTVNNSMLNKTIKCIHDHTDTGTNLVGNRTLIFTTEPYPPPAGFHLITFNVDPTYLVFAWSPLSINCSSLNYIILATNCGDCVPPGSSTTTTCSNVPINGDSCMISLRTDVCGNISGRYSEPRVINFKVVDPPILKITPSYTCVDRSLVVNIRFNKSESFEISDRIDGSAFTYTVTYSDSISGIQCASETIPSSACIEGVCIHSSMLDYHLSGCFTSDTVSVTVLATNVIGNGSLSDPILFIIPKCYGCSSGNGVVVTASVFTVILLGISVFMVILVIVTTMLIKERARILKELQTMKEYSTYEIVDLPPEAPPRSIDTTENIAYHPVSHKK